MKKLSLICFIATVYFFSQQLIAFAAELPEVPAWQNGELRITALDTVSGNRGSWQERDYITDSGARVHAVWIEGAGEKGWTPPDKSISADDGLMGSGATYRTISIAGEKALIEHHPVTGGSVAVKIEKKGSLTVESKYASGKEIIDAAAVLTTMMK